MVRLPHALQKWIRTRKALPSIKESRTPRRKPFIAEKGWKRLEVRVVSEPNPTFLILEEKLISPPLASLERLGLTQREGDVLAWVAQGKTNDNIGKVLSISPRTVSKHLEHIYQKLGVKTRTSAATFALNPNQQL